MGKITKSSAKQGRKAKRLADEEANKAKKARMDGFELDLPKVLEHLAQADNLSKMDLQERNQLVHSLAKDMDALNSVSSEVSGAMFLVTSQIEEQIARYQEQQEQLQDQDSQYDAPATQNMSSKKKTARVSPGQGPTGVTFDFKKIVRDYVKFKFFPTEKFLDNLDEACKIIFEGLDGFVQ